MLIIVAKYSALLAVLTFCGCASSIERTSNVPLPAWTKSSAAYVRWAQ